MASKKPSGIIPCYDRQRRTCIQVERTGTHVKYIPLDVNEGLQVVTATANEFDQRYEPMVNYPAEKACQLFLNYSQTIGATKEALGYLGQIVNVSKQEADMATTKKTAAAEKAAAKPAAKKAAPAKPVATKAAPAKAAAKPAAKPAAKKDGEKKMSAAQMFQDLIMQGKLADDQIFEKVQAQFGLDEKKRGYTKWYRNHLKKQGMNPPEAKVSK
jgi:pyruvate/2-oxoglutarate dehydrogenase complex dihydrolipoamide acyltransferase (E2) component